MLGGIPIKLDSKCYSLKDAFILSSIENGFDYYWESPIREDVFY